MSPPFNRKRKFFFFPFIAIAFILAGGYAVMLLWNAILPATITSVNTLTYVQAVGLLLLCRILFGGFRGRGGYGHNYKNAPMWREKMMNMSDEEKEKFKNEWKERCGKK